MKSLPLDRGDGLRREIVEHAVDAGDLVRDALGDMLQQRKGHILDRGGHGVTGVDGADDDRPLVAALAILDAHGLEVRHDGEVLPHLAGQAVLVELDRKSVV